MYLIALLIFPCWAYDWSVALLNAAGFDPNRLQIVPVFMVSLCDYV